MLRLLNTKTGEFKVFGDPRQVRYGILSHVWSTDVGEQSYERTCEIIMNTPAGMTPLSQYSDKIQRFCEVALKDGFEWGWADFSCIDKTSSSELTEAINSMFDWYRYAGTCYAFLHDLPDIDPWDPSFEEEFGSCKWFTRVWTLQELLAPTVLLFLSGTWRTIGSKYTLASVLESVTDIDSFVLTSNQPKLEDVSVARKMSWAASRTATRVEDEAYSLMGIFGVTIPISYGEGRYAFIRLQEEIVKRYPDQTIFAWGHILPPYNFTFAPPGDADGIASSLVVPPSLNEYFLASGPRDFKESSSFRCLSQGAFAKLLDLPLEHTYQVFTATSYGMHAQVPLLTIHRDDPHFNLPTHLALLACQDQNRGFLALLLRPRDEAPANGRSFFIGSVVGHTNALVGSDTLLQSHYYRVTYVSHEQVLSLRKDIQMVGLYIPHRPPVTSQKLELEEATHAALRDSRESFEVRLSGWSRTLLAHYGYTLTPTTDTNVARHDGRLVLTPSSASSTSTVVISNGDEYITIRIGRCNCALGDRYNLLAVMVSARGRSSSLGEKQFQGQHYEKQHPAHVQSWCFGGGFASKEVLLESGARDPITLRLTFSHDTQHPTGDPRTKVYRLGVEVLDMASPFESPLSASPTPMEQKSSSSRQGSSFPLVASMHATPSLLAPSLIPRTILPITTTRRPSTTFNKSLLSCQQTSRLPRSRAPMVRRCRNATAMTESPGTKPPSPLISPLPLQTTLSAPGPSSSRRSTYSDAASRYGFGPPYDPTRSGGYRQLSGPDPRRNRTPSPGVSSNDRPALSAKTVVSSSAPSRRTRALDIPKTRIPVRRGSGAKPHTVNLKLDQSKRGV